MMKNMCLKQFLYKLYFILTLIHYVHTQTDEHVWKLTNASSTNESSLPMVESVEEDESSGPWFDTPLEYVVVFWIIAILILALVVCIIILIRRTGKCKMKPSKSKINDEDEMETERLETQFGEPVNGLVSGRRPQPTRQVDKKWYDSMFIPYIDEGDEYVDVP